MELKFNKKRQEKMRKAKRILFGKKLVKTEKFIESLCDIVINANESHYKSIDFIKDHLKRAKLAKGNK